MKQSHDEPVQTLPTIHLDLVQAAAWTVLSVVRNGEFSNLGFLSNPHPAMLTFVESPRFARALRDCPQVSCVITNPSLEQEFPQVPGLAISDNPRRCFLEIHNHLATQTPFYWTDFETRVDPSARIHPRAIVAERNVTVGRNTVIGPNVTIAERTLIGDNCFIQSGAVIGSEGFQLVRSATEVLDIAHAGGIRIEAGVRILANAVISRGVFRNFTTIGSDSRIGNLAYVSHNVDLGRRSSVGHGATVNGGAHIGEEAVIGPGATIATGISIGPGASVSIGSTVVRNVAANESVTGMGALETRKMFRALKEIERRK